MNSQKNKKMEKKIYTAPHVDTVGLSYTTTLLDWSAPKADGGGGNTPEAKESIFEEESENSYSLPSINYNVWAEEEEE